jgi:iron complex transport system substrate-binding protein
MQTERIVSLSPNISLALFALGEGHRVIGKTTYCLRAIEQWVATGQDRVLAPEHPSAALLAHWRGIPEFGTWAKPAREQVRQLRPDLVLSSGTVLQGTAEDFGVPENRYVHFDTRRLEQLHEEIRTIGKLIGREAEARELLGRLDEQVKSLLGKLRKAPRPARVFHEKCVCIKTESFANPRKYVMAGGHLLPDLIRLIGHEYPFVQPGEESRWIESSEVEAWSPEIILENRCFHCPVQEQNLVAQREFWSDLPALKTGSIFSPSVNLSNPSLTFPVGLGELVDFVNDHLERCSGQEA